MTITFQAPRIWPRFGVFHRPAESSPVMIAEALQNVLTDERLDLSAVTITLNGAC